MCAETIQSTQEFIPHEPIKEALESAPEKLEGEPLPPALQNTELFAENSDPETLDSIYKWYESSMRRRNREPLPQTNFQRHFFKDGSLVPTCMYGDQNYGYLLGLRKRGIFIPTHFAPKTLKGGYNLFKELASSREVPVVTAVTEDLAQTLKKNEGLAHIKSKPFSVSERQFVRQDRCLQQLS